MMEELFLLVRVEVDIKKKNHHVKDAIILIQSVVLSVNVK